MTIAERGERYSALLSANFDKLITKMKPEFIPQYQYLMETYRASDIRNNTEFKKAFKKYYTMNRVTKKYFPAFFEVMEKQKSSAKPDFLAVANELSPVLGLHHFSFITKMLHTRFDDYPIYDKFVSNFFKLTIPSGLTIDQRINQSVSIIDTIAETYDYILEHHLADSIFNEFDRRYPNNITFVRKLDFLIWSHGKYYEDRAKP